MKVYLISYNSDKIRMATDLTSLDINYDHFNKNNSSTVVEKIQSSDIVLMLATNKDYAYTNESVELGIALGCNKQIWFISNGNPYTKINNHLDNKLVKRFNSWESCLKALNDLTNTTVPYFKEEERSPPLVSNFS